ncbi:MAG: MopE-related protein [Myxococcota bacterium]
MPAFARLVFTLALLAGCSGEKPIDTAGEVPDDPDADADGSPASLDCDDGDAARFPGAEETCNAVDDDCDGTTDEEAVDMATVYADADGDGAGDEAAALTTCDTPAGYVATAGDCDDADAAIGPNVREMCDAADVDENCNGTADDADATVDATTAASWYVDADGDGHGDPATVVVACDVFEARVDVGDDCDDTRADVHPATPEICDDADIDEDCSGAADDADPGVDVGTLTSWYADADTDGHGDPADVTNTCDVPAGYVADATDCDPARADVSPSALEGCDEVDVGEDGDGGADNDDPGALGELDWFADTDGDGHGDAAAAMLACDRPEAYVDVATDCDDTLATVFPGAPEQCDTLANDCDTLATWTSDAERGVASWIDEAGAWSVVTDTLAAGTGDAPVAWAASSDGELKLCAGTWYATLDGSHTSLVVTGAGAEETLLDAGGMDTVVASTGGTLALSGVTLTNGAGANGGGLSCLSTDLVLDGVIVTANLATASGGGVFLQACDDATLLDVTIAGNAATAGGGLYATNAHGLVIDGATITGNEAVTVGGGVSLANTTFDIGDTEVRGNAAGASYAAGGLSVSSSTGTLTGVTVADNEAGSAAGLLAAVSTVDITDGTFTGNVASQHGAALHAFYTATVRATGTTFSGNLSGSGAPLWLDTNVTGTFTACVFSANEGQDAGVFGFTGTASAAVVTSDFDGNAPNDAYAAGNAYTFGAGATVTCDDATGCY